MSLLLAAHTTDTPVWWLFGATAALALVTGALATAGWKALDQLKEARKDRHVHVVAEFGRRWNSEMMLRALGLEAEYEPQDLADLVRFVRSADTDGGFWHQKRLTAARRKLMLLLRIPDFFEDLAFMANFASLEDESLAAFKGLAIGEWDIWKPAILALRDTGDEFSYKQFEGLVERMDAVPDL
jgi:hypothetical protein